jgi:hypothetical protein
MILLTFRDGDDLRLGARTSGGVIDVAVAQAALGADGGVPAALRPSLAVVMWAAPRSAISSLEPKRPIPLTRHG